MSSLHGGSLSILDHITVAWGLPLNSRLPACTHSDPTLDHRCLGASSGAYRSDSCRGTCLKKKPQTSVLRRASRTGPAWGTNAPSILPLSASDPGPGVPRALQRHMSHLGRFRCEQDKGSLEEKLLALSSRYWCSTRRQDQVSKLSAECPARRSARPTQVWTAPASAVECTWTVSPASSEPVTRARLLSARVFRGHGLPRCRCDQPHSLLPWTVF